MTRLLLEVTASLSEFVNVPLGKQVKEMDTSPQLDAYSGVEIVIDDDTSVFAGNRSGRVLEIQNPWGTQEQAQNILASLMSTGFQYQPYTASGALLNPAAEIGDGVTLNGVYSGIYKMTRRYGSMADADISAPQDEQIDHEYPYEPKQDRVYKREIADAQAQITINSNAISAEVFRATSVEESLQSAISQTAEEISATVLRKTGGSSSSFGWTLTDSSWELKSGGSTVFKATASGIEISGKVTAISGKIANFTIATNKLYSGMSGINSTSNGVYIGTDGIAVGGGNFKVTSSGSVSAKNMSLSGTLSIGGTNITAEALRSGAQSAYSNGSYWSNGSGYGYNYNAATAYGASGPTYFNCSTLYANSIIYNGAKMQKYTTGIKDGDGIMRYITYYA